MAAEHPAAKPLRSRLDRMCDEVDAVYEEFRRLEAVLAAYRRALAANDLEALAAVSV